MVGRKSNAVILVVLISCFCIGSSQDFSMPEVNPVSVEVQEGQNVSLQCVVPEGAQPVNVTWIRLTPQQVMDVLQKYSNSCLQESGSGVESRSGSDDYSSIGPDDSGSDSYSGIGPDSESDISGPDSDSSGAENDGSRNESAGSIGSGSGRDGGGGGGSGSGSGSGSMASGSGGSGSASGSGGSDTTAPPVDVLREFEIAAPNFTVQFGDEGSYVCRVQRDDQTCVSQPITLSIVPEISNISSSSVYERDSDVMLQCITEGGPMNTFQWFMENTLLTDMDNMSIINTSSYQSILLLFNVSASTGGEYSCVVSNAAGNDTANTSVSISPYFTYQPVDKEATNGSMVTLMCEAEAFPSPEYVWGRVDAEEIRSEIVTDSFMLVLDPVQFGDEGGYYCNATSGEVSMQSETAIVTVSPEGSVMVSSNNTGVAGDTVLLQCTASGGPGNNFTWFRTNVTDGEFLIDGDQYTIVDLGVMDGGEYVCLVSNAAGEDGSSITVDILPEIITPSREVNVTVSVTLREKLALLCEATGFPVPVVQWRHNGTTVNGTIVSENTTTITSMYEADMVTSNDTGNYSCSVQNRLGSDRVDVIVLVLNTPERPQDVMAVDVSSREINLTWVEPHDNNAPITRYEITYMQPEFVEGERERVVNSTVSPQDDFNVSTIEMITITDLLPGVDYTFTVTAFNDIGSSAPSDPLPVRTLDEAPDSPPDNVMATVVSSTEIMVTWDSVPLIHQNGIITMYEVLYQPLETFGGAIQTLTRNVSAPEMSVILRDLEEFVNYTISVRAYTSVGEGPYSDGVTVMTQEDNPASAPDNVNAVANSSTTIIVTWDSVVPPMDQNGIITMYKVLYQPLETFGGAIQTLTKNVSAPEMSVVLMNLQEFVNYTISVRAYTSVGEGPYSEEMTVMTQQDNPNNPPDNVTATALSSTEIMVTWDSVPLIDQNGIITMYEVFYIPLETFGGSISSNVTTVTNMSALLTGLKEFVQYNVSVRAYTSVGEGPYSEGEVIRTNETIPSAPPDNVMATVLSSTEIMVTWDSVPLIDQNGIITMYEVLYIPLETFDDAIGPLTVTTTELTADLTDLQEFVNYNISVRAYTSVGEGPYSEDVTQLTNEDVPDSPPDNVAAAAPSSTEIMVTWDSVPPIDQNGIITMYEVLYQPLQTFGGAIQTLTRNVTAPEMSVVLMDFQEFVNYAISVRAYTSVGEGPYSEEVTQITNEDAPASPPNDVEATVVSSTEIMVTWDSVPLMEQNGIITMYEVLYQPLQTFGGAIQTLTRNVSAPEMSVVLVNLQEFVQYNISVRAYTSVGEGPYSDGVNETTQQDAPSSPPQNVSAMTVSSRVVLVTWEEVEPEIDWNGIITGYEVLLQSSAPEGNVSLSNVTGLQTNVSGLTPNVLYNVIVRASTVAGGGPFSSPPSSVTTFQDIPGPVSEPPEVPLEEISSTSAVISWDEPSEPNGVIQSYMINLVAVSSVSGRRRRRRKKRQIETCVIGEVESDMSVPGNQTSLTLSNLTPYTVYNFSVQAVTGVGPGDFSPPREFTTRPGEPDSVRELLVSAISSTALRVSWTSPECPYGVISSYIVYYRESDTAQTTDISSELDGYTSVTKPASPNIMQYSLDITGLTVFTYYAVHVQAVVNESLSGRVELEELRRTYSSVPDMGPTAPPTNTPTAPPSTASVTVLVADPRQITTGRVIFCAVVVVEESGRIDETSYDDALPYVEGAMSYITAAWDESDVYNDRVPSRITVGDGITYMAEFRGRETTFINAPLKANTEYKIFTRYDIANDEADEPHRVFSSVTSSKTTAADSSIAIIIAILFIIILLVVIIIIVVLVLLYWRYRKGDFVAKILRNSPTENVHPHVELQSFTKNPEYTEETEPFSIPDPVPVGSFNNYVHQHHLEDNSLFADEYKSVEPNHTPTSTATQNPDNVIKNRYANITAYDHSRVRLQEIENEPNSDYINANFLDGYKSKNSFIAAQGPVPASVPDFWRMIWEQNVGYLVMVTNLEEKGRIKCHKYWPDEAKKSFKQGPFQIHVQEVLVLAEYTVRTFSLQREGCKTERIVRQFHFTVWPDHGVPEYPAQLLHFVNKVLQVNPLKDGPMVVHCSAGVGRTGTFITIFTQLQRIKAEGTVDVFGFVRSMRRRRCYMVQTEDQYVFIHDALLEAIECGITEVAARDLPKQFRKLSNGTLEEEFARVSSTLHNKLSQTAYALPRHKPKNRCSDPTLAPYDKTRVVLETSTPDGLDYINASHIDGYHKLGAYIATQGPMQGTAADFWQMIWEQNCNTIVALTERKETNCDRYWPDAGVKNVSYLQVIHCSEASYPDYVLREFNLVDTRDGSTQQVKQYHYGEWSEDTVPENSAALIDLIGQVQKWQRSCDDNTIVVHCSDGCGRTGTFIAVSILMERLKTEGVVDVFHTVRTLCLQRPQMVTTLAQYEFCYKTVLEFLDSFELYSNFK